MADETTLKPLTKSVQVTQTVQRKVRIRVVEEVSDLDYPQAKRAWEALERAGLSPGKIVANALKEGHGYKVVEINVDQPFANKKEEGLVGESASSEDALVGYQYVNKDDLLAQIEGPNSNQALANISNAIVAATEEVDEEGVDMTGIRRQKFTQISNSTDITTKKEQV